MLADAIRAYIHADLKGPRFFVELPPEAWPSWVKLQDYRRPVVRLRQALYGHPDSGTMWEQHCDKAVKEVGSRRLSANLLFHKGAPGVHALFYM